MSEENLDINRIKALAWQECVDWLAYNGQGDIKGRLVEWAENANPYRDDDMEGVPYV